MSSPLPARREPTLQPIWTAYRRERELVHRNELIVAYQPLIALTVQRLPARVLTYWELDELRSFGQDGLLRAITRWNDPDIARFESYAQRCIRGAVFDELRRLDWVPRSLRRRIIAYNATFEALTRNFGRIPTSSETCIAMGLSPRQQEELLAALGASQLLHLDGRAVGSHGALPVIEMLADQGSGPENELIATIDIESLYGAAAVLDAREYKVVLLAFFGNLTQEQIGKIIGVGGPQVCKIQRSALRKLRSVLENGHRFATIATANARLPVVRTTLSRPSLDVGTLARR